MMNSFCVIFLFLLILGWQGGGGEMHYKNTLLVLSLFMNNAIVFTLGKKIDVCRNVGLTFDSKDN